MLLRLDELKRSGQACLRVLHQRLLLDSIDGYLDGVGGETVGKSGHPSTLITHLWEYIRWVLECIEVVVRKLWMRLGDVVFAPFLISVCFVD